MQDLNELMRKAWRLSDKAMAISYQLSDNLAKQVRQAARDANYAAWNAARVAANKFWASEKYRDDALFAVLNDLNDNIKVVELALRVAEHAINKQSDSYV